MERSRKCGDVIRDAGYPRFTECLPSLPESVREIILQVKTGQVEDLAVTVAEIMTASERPVSLLYDPSKGRGVYHPSSWHSVAHPFPCGFAGGLNTESIAAALERLSFFLDPAKQIWIGMQTGAKTDGRLDLHKVRVLLQACRPYT